MTEFAVKDILDPAKLQADLSINENDLDTGMLRQSGLFAYYGALHAQAEQQLSRMEQLQEIIEARLDRKARDAAAASGTKITEAQVKAAIALEPKAIAIKTAVNKARMVTSLCKSAVDAFRNRRDMLIQLAFNSRSERKGELRLTEGQLEAQQARSMERESRLASMFSQGG